ncbi:PadR family transcriptional regulator [Streptomyces sp. NBC_00989]|uniref:PadR family transcriptional regulator n=1 Tax=Streptomyces sp. NBC_00989 TaxID=2903705 RepID=UPI002F90DB07|nr:PadR family transcriptional regulator [Streptomyces sp. NBC_00989]
MDQKTLTPAVVRMLQTFLEDPDRTFYASELMRAAHVGSGSLYPGLANMEKAGWVTCEIEDVDPKEAGRPARHYYRMTGLGVRAAHMALVELSDSVRPPQSSPGWKLGPQASRIVGCLTGTIGRLRPSTDRI